MSSSDQTPTILIALFAFFLAFVALVTAAVGGYWWHGRYERDLKEVCAVATEVSRIKSKEDQEMMAHRGWESRLKTPEMKGTLTVISSLPVERRMVAFEDFVVSLGEGPVRCPDLEKLWTAEEKTEEKTAPPESPDELGIAEGRETTDPKPSAPPGDLMVVLGALDRSVIEAVVKRNRAQIQYCYQRELTKNPNLAGSVTVKFVIARDGTVSTATTKSTTLRNELVEACINARFMRFQFPEPRGGGIVVVSYPFVFSPG